MKFSQYPFNVPDVPKIQKQLTKYIEQFKNAKDTNAASRVMRKISKYVDDFVTDAVIISVKFSQDSRNEEYVKAQEYVDHHFPYLSALMNEYNKLLVASPFRAELEKKWGSYLFKMIETQLKTFDPSIIELLQKESQLTNEYSKLIASAQIKFDGEVYNIPQMGKFTQDKNRDVRKRASAAVVKFFEENNDELGRIYHELVQVRHAMAVKLGYKNFIELGYLKLGRLDYTAKEVAGYRDQIYREVVPLAHKLYRTSLRRAGIKSPRHYDLNQSFSDGNPVPLGDSKYLVKAATKMYDELSPETGEFFRFMVDKELLDLDARPGKRGGGYMTYFPRYQAPFIFANFNGTAGDVDTLTHEVGHAYQGYESRHIKVSEYRQPTLEACEIHSMSMEFFAWPWMESMFDDADKYRLSHLEGTIKFLPYGVAVDEFQEGVYANPEMTHEERCAMWREIEKKYLPIRNYKGAPFLEKGTFWLRQSHIFSSPFYYIDYTLAQVVAFQFATEMWKNRDRAWNKYVKLCRLGGRYPFVELLAKAKLRNPFEDGNVRRVITPLKRKLKELTQVLESKYD